MIVSKDINPVNTVYYNATIVLAAMKDIDNDSFDFFELYKNVKLKLSIQSFIFSLDWLFLLGVVNIDVKGKISKCF